MSLSLLVVDDDRDSSDVLRELLGFLGNSAVSCTDGPSAAALSAAHSIDAAFVDVAMPGADGFAVCRSIRMIRPDAVVILITGLPLNRVQQSAHDAGALLTLEKPLSVETLTDALAAVRAFKGAALA